MAKTNAAGQKTPERQNETRMPLSKKNYVLMLIGVGMVIAGFLLMAGGGSDDRAVFNPEMFSFRRITLAPIVVVAGLVFEIFAIMWRPKRQQ